MNAYPAPNSIILIDNAWIHHSQEVLDVIEQFGKQLGNSVAHSDIIEFLSPYFHDYQPIELTFSAIKAHLKQQGLGFFDADQIFYELYNACCIITPAMTWGFWHHCGYL